MKCNNSPRPSSLARLWSVFACLGRSKRCHKVPIKRQMKFGNEKCDASQSVGVQTRAFIDGFMALLILLRLGESHKTRKNVPDLGTFRRSEDREIDYLEIVFNKTKIVINRDLNNRMKFRCFCSFPSEVFTRE